MFAADVHLSPSITALPGSQVLQQLANGLAAWALVGSLIALVIGAVVWALGSHSQNMHQSMAGRRAVVTAVAAALLVGGAPAIINFFFHAGSLVR
jgi:cobalamin synthase